MQPENAINETSSRFYFLLTLILIFSLAYTTHTQKKPFDLHMAINITPDLSSCFT